MSALPLETCQQPCDPDCELGPVHCYWAHEPNHKTGWHDSKECDRSQAFAFELMRAPSNEQVRDEMVRRGWTYVGDTENGIPVLMRRWTDETI